MAFMVAFHSKGVFESPFLSSEHCLVDLATRLVERFERIARYVLENGRVSRELTADVLPLMGKFIECFQAWKGPDQERLEKRLCRMLAMLEDSLAIYRIEDPGNTLDAPKLEAENSRLRDRLARLVGREALDKYDESRWEVRGKVIRRLGLTPSNHSMSARTNNEELAHELLLDPTFQLLESGACAEGTLGQVVRDKFHQVLLSVFLDVYPFPFHN